LIENILKSLAGFIFDLLELGHVGGDGAGFLRDE
jgi:hypothetical protein